MPLLLDLFGVVWQHTLNTPLLNAVQSLRLPNGGVYLASNMGRIEKAAMCLKNPALLTQLDGIFYSGALGVAKPDARFYTQITAQLAVSPQQIVFFDDSPANVVAAMQQGWHSFIYESPQQVANMAQLYLTD